MITATPFTKGLRSAVKLLDIEGVALLSNLCYVVDILTAPGRGTGCQSTDNMGQEVGTRAVALITVARAYRGLARGIHIQSLLMGTMYVSSSFHSSSFVAYAELMCRNDFHGFRRSLTISNFHTKKVLSTPLPSITNLFLSSCCLRLPGEYLRLDHFVPSFQVSSISTPFSSTCILTASPARRMKLYPALAVHRCPTYLYFQLLRL